MIVSRTRKNDWLSPRRQYTLADLLLFTVAVSVYFAMMASVSTLLVWDRGLPPSPLPVVVAILIAWCMLWWLYRRWRLPHALRIHYTGPIVAMVLLAIMGFIFTLDAISFPLQHGSFLTNIREALAVTAVAMLIGCGLSTAVSFPAAVLMLLYLCLRPVPKDTA